MVLYGCKLKDDNKNIATFEAVVKKLLYCDLKSVYNIELQSCSATFTNIKDTT